MPQVIWQWFSEALPLVTWGKGFNNSHMEFSDFNPVALESQSAAEIALLDEALPSECPDIWREFAYCFFAVLRADENTAALPAQKAANLAIRQVYQLACDFGGDNFYLPLGHKMTAAKKAEEAVRLFKRMDVTSVAKTLGVTNSRVLQILREDRRKKMSRERG